MGCHLTLIQCKDAEVLLPAVVPDCFFKCTDVFDEDPRIRFATAFWMIGVDDMVVLLLSSNTRSILKYYLLLLLRVLAITRRPFRDDLFRFFNRLLEPPDISPPAANMGGSGGSTPAAKNAPISKHPTPT